jgi:hypothetical protein
VLRTSGTRRRMSLECHVQTHGPRPQNLSRLCSTQHHGYQSLKRWWTCWMCRSERRSCSMRSRGVCQLRCIGRERFKKSVGDPRKMLGKNLQVTTQFRVAQTLLCSSPLSTLISLSLSLPAICEPRIRHFVAHGAVIMRFLLIMMIVFWLEAKLYTHTHTYIHTHTVPNALRMFHHVS